MAQKTGLDYLQRLILKSRKDFSSNAMLFISEKVGLPHLANPPPGMMVPCVPKSYVDKCSTDLATLTTFSPEAQASFFSKVFSCLLFFCNFLFQLYMLHHLHVDITSTKRFSSW